MKEGSHNKSHRVRKVQNGPPTCPAKKISGGQQEEGQGVVHHVLFNMGDLHLILTGLNLSTLNAGGVVAYEILVSAQGPLVLGFGANGLGPGLDNILLIGNRALFILLITIRLIKIYLKQFRNFVAVLHFIRIIVSSMTISAINFKSITPNNSS